jgi:hypothetical protein
VLAVLEDHLVSGAGRFLPQARVRPLQIREEVAGAGASHEQGRHV